MLYLKPSKLEYKLKAGNHILSDIVLSDISGFEELILLVLYHGASEKNVPENAKHILSSASPGLI